MSELQDFNQRVIREFRANHGQVSGQLAKQTPSKPATVADALPLVPGVVREPGGGLKISDASEHRSALIVNSADVTDPATGEFGLTVQPVVPRPGH